MISMILAAFRMNDGISRKSYLLFGRYKDDWDIGTYLKPHFEKKNILNNFEILRLLFPTSLEKEASEHSSFAYASLKHNW